MTPDQLAEMTIEQLVKRFVLVTQNQDMALDQDDNDLYNEWFDPMLAVEAELKNRGGDQRRALLPLLDHKNSQVRLMAGIATLKVAPTEARAALQRIIDEKDYPHAVDALGILRSLDEGRYVPE